MKIQHESPSSLGLSYKRLFPLAPKLTGNSSSPPSSYSGVTFDLKSFITTNQTSPSPRRFHYHVEHKQDSPQTQLGGTRWNPTQEQIGILEMLYKDGMRTPNTQQIEHITSQLSTYGTIEGKNVFYWFQNHKARERQKHKRNNLSCQSSFKTTTTDFNQTVTTKTRTSSLLDIREELIEENIYKRRCRSWRFKNLEKEMRENINRSNNVTLATTFDNVTLELFPLHPEGR